MRLFHIPMGIPYWLPFCQLSCFLACLLAANGWAGAPTVVQSVKQLEAELGRLEPGAIIELADGEHTTAHAIRLEGIHGTLANPIILRAEHRGQAVIIGNAGFALKECEHVMLEGFTFKHDADQPAVLLNNCQQVRVSRNTFRLSERANPRHMEHWVYLIGSRSAHNRLDHNLFDHKINRGSPLFSRGDDAALVCSQHDRIDRNHFRDVVNGHGENGHETLRTGGNDLGASGQSSFTTIEENLFERCSGEEEIISLKSSDNVVRNNTFVNCSGAINLRLGNRDVVSGNFMLATDGQPGCGGVKLYGFDHRVFNNYFQGLTGTRHQAPLALVPGTLATPTTDKIGKQYNDLTTVPPTKAWIAFNTWIDCSPLEFGWKQDKERAHIPDDCTFVNNLVVHTKPQAKPLVSLKLVAKLHALNNLGSSCGKSFDQSWAAWFRSADPGLCPSKDSAGLWRLTASSSAIDAAIENGPAIAEDVFGRPRTAPRDLGAEEYTSEPIRRQPLSANDVGPGAP